MSKPEHFDLGKFVDYVHGLRDERDRLKAELAALRTTHPAPASVGGVEAEPVAIANRGQCAFWVKWTDAAKGLYGPGIKLYTHPAATVPAADLVRQCIAEELASWTGDYRCPVGRALHDLQQRIDSALLEVKP